MSDFPVFPHKRIIKASEADSWVDGFAFLKRARKTAAEIRAQARDEVAKAADLGRKEGRYEGEVEAADLLVRTHKEVDAYFASVEPRLAELAIGIVQEIMGSFSDAELVARVVSRALQDLRAEEKIVVAVAPELVSEVEEILRLDDQLRPLFCVVADRHLTGRQCLVTTAATSIDVSVDAQIDAIRSVMLKARSVA